MKANIPGSKPVPFSVTVVPPDIGPAAGETDVSDSPTSCVNVADDCPTPTTTLLRGGSGLASLAVNSIVPLPTPCGADIAGPNHDWFQSHSAHHIVCGWVVTVKLPVPPRPGTR